MNRPRPRLCSLAALSALAWPLVLAGTPGCARDCTPLVEQRCRTAGLSDADCGALARKAAEVPAQACEAILQALESRHAPSRP